MSKVLVVYWSGTGNTERMAELVSGGAVSSGAEVTLKRVSEASVGEIVKYDVVAFGSPAMGTEVIEENEMEPFFAEAGTIIAGRKVALFGSYGWGDGEWMRTWAARARRSGALLLDEGLAVNETPSGASADLCVEYGRKIAAF